MGSSDTFTTTHAAETLTIASHGYTDDNGPIHVSSTGQLPTGLAPFKATNGLTFTPGTIADDVVEINGVYYEWAADPTAGTPDGSVGTPYLVDVGADDEESLLHLLLAITDTGSGGTDYSAEITAAHSTVFAVASNATTVTLRAILAGVAGNAYTLSVAGADGVAADAALFSGGLDAVGYFISVSDANTIQLALTAGGAAVEFSDDGSGTHSLGETASSLMDAIESVITGRMTRFGSRAHPPSIAVPKFWEAVLEAIA